MASSSRPFRRSLLLGALLFAIAPGSRAICSPNPSDPTVRASSEEIDRLVLGRLRHLGIEPAPVCADEVFVRRAYLDVIGTLPTLQEARAFLADKGSDKRDVLIDRLLARDEFADYWAMKWCNLLRVKSEFPINLWPNAVQAYHHWIRQSVKDGVPYDQFARQLLTTSGSNFRAAPVNFYRAVQGKDPKSLAEAVALTFLGMRAEAWPKNRLDGMAAFFARIGYKGTAEWKEEIVFDDLTKANAPTSAVFPDGSMAALTLDKDPREVFADWLVRPGNPYFARAIANRVWSWFLGRGVVEEPDDLRPDNPPSNPELLSFLEREVVGARFDLKRLFHAILSSQTYQRSSVPASADPRSEAEFACYAVRRLEPEVLIDAIDQVTGTTEEYTSKIPEPFTVMPAEQRAIALPDASVTSPFLELFGRSSRDTGLESEQRGSLPTSAQALHLLNSTHVRRKLEQGPGLKALLQPVAGKPKESLDALYLAILSRPPTPDDLRAIGSYAGPPAAPGRPAGKGAPPAPQGARLALDIAWALVNSTEFQYRH